MFSSIYLHGSFFWVQTAVVCVTILAIQYFYFRKNYLISNNQRVTWSESLLWSAHYFHIYLQLMLSGGPGSNSLISVGGLEITEFIHVDTSSSSHQIKKKKKTLDSIVCDLARHLRSQSHVILSRYSPTLHFSDKCTQKHIVTCSKVGSRINVFLTSLAQFSTLWFIWQLI